MTEGSWKRRPTRSTLMQGKQRKPGPRLEEYSCIKVDERYSRKYTAILRSLCFAWKLTKGMPRVVVLTWHHSKTPGQCRTPLRSTVEIMSLSIPFVNFHAKTGRFTAENSAEHTLCQLSCVITGIGDVRIPGDNSPAQHMQQAVTEPELRGIRQAARESPAAIWGEPGA